MNREIKRPRVAIIGPGSIGLDLMYKIKKHNNFQLAFMIGHNRNSEGLKLDSIFRYLTVESLAAHIF